VPNANSFYCLSGTSVGEQDAAEVKEKRTKRIHLIIHNLLEIR
jgi:hypothetical protein